MLPSVPRPVAFVGLLLVLSALDSRALAQSPPAHAAPASAPAETMARPAWTLGGQLFADYFVVAAHDPRREPAAAGPGAGDDLEGRQAFWFRRVYLTYDQRFTQRLSARVRLEANTPGDFVSDARLEPFVKDAYVQARLQGHALWVGLVPTASLRLTEQVWGLRSVEKTPVDLFRLDSSRDLGVLAAGPLTSSGRWRYEFQAGNGAGVSSETNDAKTVRGAISHEAPHGLTAQAYVDHQARSGAGDWTTVKLLAAWREPRWRLGGVYAFQRRRALDGAGRPLDLDLVSVFGVAALHPRVNLFGRVDRVFDALPDATDIDYLPLSSVAPPTVFIAGADIAIEGPLRLQPHLEVVTYDGDGQPRPGPTVVPRITLALSW
jgi:hypothetical protein